METGASSALLAEALEDRSAELDEGAEARSSDLILALIAAGFANRQGVIDDPTDCIGEDPRDKDGRHAVDGPLNPKAADDRRGLVSGTSPDPAPEIDGDGSVSDCEEGFTVFQGECLPEAVVEGLLALGMDPDAPPPPGQ